MNRCRRTSHSWCVFCGSIDRILIYRKDRIYHLLSCFEKEKKDLKSIPFINDTNFGKSLFDKSTVSYSMRNQAKIVETKFDFKAVFVKNSLQTTIVIQNFILQTILAFKLNIFLRRTLNRNWTILTMKNLNLFVILNKQSIWYF